VITALRRELQKLKPIEEPARDNSFFGLKALIKASRFIAPLLVSKDDLVVDGCRRLVIGHELGKAYLDVLVLDRDYTREELLKLRAALHCSRRLPDLNEMMLVSGNGNPQKNFIEKPDARKVEQVINDLLCAQGLGPRIMMEIVKRTPVVLPSFQEDEEESSLEQTLEELGWKSELQETRQNW